MPRGIVFSVSADWFLHDRIHKLAGHGKGDRLERVDAQLEKLARVFDALDGFTRIFGHEQLRVLPVAHQPDAEIAPVGKLTSQSQRKLRTLDPDA